LNTFLNIFPPVLFAMVSFASNGINGSLCTTMTPSGAMTRTLQFPTPVIENQPNPDMTISQPA